MRRSGRARIVRRIRHDLIYVVVRVLAAVACRIPRNAGLVLFECVGRCIPNFMTRDREIARRNVAEVLGAGWDRARIGRFVADVYGQLGRNIFDALYLARRGREELFRLVECDSLDEFREAYGQGKGIITLIAHMGCFEMLLHYFAASGFKCCAIGRRLSDERIDRIVTGLRSGENIRYLYRDDNARQIVESLREGRVMGVLIDQDTKVDGVFAHFLGRQAHTPIGPIRLAMRYDIPVFVVTTARRKDDTHRIFISRRLALDNTGERDRDVVMNVAKANAVLSEAIMRNPRQWVWMHERWRKRPTDPGMTGIPTIEQYEHVS